MYIPENDEDDEGAPERFVLDFLEANKIMVVLDVDSDRRVLTAFFEYRVADILHDWGYDVRRNPPVRLLEAKGVHLPMSQGDPSRTNQLDLIGFKQGEVLLVECKCYVPRDRNHQPAIPKEHALQAARFLETRLDDADRKLKVWLVTNATTTEDDSIWEIPGIEIYSTGNTLASTLRTCGRGKKWSAMLEGSLRLELAPMRRNQV
jgi:hypothetical protein